MIINGLSSTVRRHRSRLAGSLVLVVTSVLLTVTVIASLSVTSAQAASTRSSTAAASVQISSAQKALFSTANAWKPSAPKTETGWQADFVDNFDSSLNTGVWGRYMAGVPTGTTSAYLKDNATVTRSPLSAGGGVLQLHTRYQNGHWTSAGLSSGRGFAATQGKWQIKAKFDRAYGVGYAILLYPKGGAWPPEIDLAEGTAGGNHIMATVHYGTAKQNFQIQRFLFTVDMTKWHIYGVSVTNSEIDYLIDGKIWAKVKTSHTPRVPMWLGVQAGVKDCRHSTGECLSATTPKSSAISIDWVAHYRRT